MAYFEPYIDAEGVHAPTYEDILEYFMTQYRAIFGEDVYLGEETPDYQLLSLVAKSMSDYTALATQAYFERDPQYASGNSLDILCQLSGITRRLPTFSTVVLTLEGIPGTVVAKGSQAIDANGHIWSTDNDAMIDSEGTADVSATCDEPGAIKAPAGEINSVYTPYPGWTGVVNESDAESGTNMETDAELRIRFAASHATSSNGATSSFITGLLSVPGVKFADIVENNTGLQSGDLPAHSFCAVVDGGTADAVAKKILDLKAPGVATAGNTTVEVEDSDGNTYEINFSRPTATSVPIVVTIKDLGGYDADRVDGIIKQSLMDDINSLGIGKSWALTMGYKDIYSQFMSGSMPFAVVGITSTAADADGIVECTYDHVLTTIESSISIVEDT